MIDAFAYVCYAPKTGDHLCGQEIGFKVLQPYILPVLSYAMSIKTLCGAGDVIFTVCRAKRRGPVNGAQ